MSSFNANSQMYNIMSENELSDVLSHYDSRLVYSVVQEAMDKRKSEVPIIPLPNVVGAWEQNFKQYYSVYTDPEMISEITKVRNTTYTEIIDLICKEFNLSFTISEVDLFSAAYALYNFFVCNFSNNLSLFFAKYIYKERSSIFDSMNLAERKKNKDTTTIYSKKIFKDAKLAIVNASIGEVIYNISGMEFELHSIINITEDSKEIAAFLLELVSPNGDFFKDSYIQIMRNPVLAPQYETNIRMLLKDIAAAHDQINSL